MGSPLPLIIKDIFIEDFVTKVLASHGTGVIDGKGETRRKRSNKRETKM